MIKFQINSEDLAAYVQLDSERPNESKEINYSGDSLLVEKIRNHVYGSYGVFGHLIKNVASPIDLYSILSRLDSKVFKIKVLEGSEMVNSYDPGIPEGSLT